jgi:hypothetical protein
MMDMNNQYDAAALYDGGWRSEDKEELMSEYGLSEDEADELCEALKAYEQ